MILSMTGFGQASTELGKKTFRIEIKSLNGKTTDIRFKSNSNLRDKEIELRKIILDNALRGKFDVNLLIESSTGDEDCFLNTNLMQRYFDDLKAFADKNEIVAGDMLQSIIRLPNIVQINEGELTDDEWNLIKEMTLKALGQLRDFRSVEGQSMEKDILSRSRKINDLLSSISQFEAERIQNLRDRIKKNLNQFLKKENVDENRFEQEIVFYLEKLDINEEKVRLAQHCKFFEEAVNNSVVQKGKKLSFISQEMGREINTLGAKAQHPELQQAVVNMKDELEKIKEQVLNIL